MSEIASWYYVGSFGQLGPLTKEQLEELIEGGVIEKQTYVWRPGMNDWLPAGSVPELSKTFSIMEPYSAPPPTPPTPSMPPAQMAAPSPQPFAPIPNQNLPKPTFGYTLPAGIPKSDKSRTASGILQLIIPGAGRIYLGYSALGVIQLVMAIVTCGTLHIWSIIDGVLLLSGQVRLDGYGRALED